MPMVLRAMVALILGLLPIAVPSPGQAVEIESVRVTVTQQMPAFRPDWPIPQEPNQMFYLQRSINSNTVVYTALFDEDGNLRADRPAQVYWRRYNTTGERKALKPFENRFAFGVNVQPAEEPGTYVVNLKAAPQFPMTLRQTGPGRAELLATIGGRTVHPVYAYVLVDERRLLPSVVGFALYGVDVRTGEAIGEIFDVRGGGFRY